MKSWKPQERFSNRVEDYILARPGYPAEILAFLEKEIDFNPDWTLADIGSGTGISTKLFLKYGCIAYGVEPNKLMRQAAEASLSKYPRFHSVEGSAEETTLPDRSVDLIVAAQAVHWFELKRVRPEFKRILKNGGFCLLIWNERLTKDTPFLAEYETLNIHFGKDYEAMISKTRNALMQAETELFAPGVKHALIPYSQTLDKEGLIARILSCSYMPSRNDPEFEAMTKAFEALFDKYQDKGCVTIRYATHLYYGSV